MTLTRKRHHNLRSSKSSRIPSKRCTTSSMVGLNINRKKRSEWPLFRDFLTHVSDETAHETKPQVFVSSIVVALAKMLTHSLKTIKLENAPLKNKIRSCPQTLYGNSRMVIKLVFCKFWPWDRLVTCSINVLDSEVLNWTRLSGRAIRTSTHDSTRRALF